MSLSTCMYIFRLGVELWHKAPTGVETARACRPLWWRFATRKPWLWGGRWSGAAKQASWGGWAPWPPTNCFQQSHTHKENQCSDSFAVKFLGWWRLQWFSLVIVKLEQITSKIDTNAFNCKCNGTYSNIVIDKSRESEAQIGSWNVCN